ncbi:hypothetical protein GGH91_003623, partial [Coemansia sp. RSA 2671]
MSPPLYADMPYYPNVRFPSKRRFSAPYTPHTGVYNAPHHTGGQPVSQPMGYGVQLSTGWVAPLPYQYAYMHMGDPGYEQCYPASPVASASQPPNIYGVPSYGPLSSTPDMVPLASAPSVAASPVSVRHSI